MLTYKVVRGLKGPLVSTIITRNKGTARDPVQQLFLDKLKEYRSKSPNDDLLEPSQSVLKELTRELDKLDKHYGGGKGVDMTAFPTFKFEEPKLDPIDEAVPEKAGKKKRTLRKKKAPVVAKTDKKNPKK